MENINLLHDRGNDGNNDAQKHQTGSVSFTQPEPSSESPLTPKKPSGGFWRSIAEVFSFFGGKAKGQSKEKPQSVDGASGAGTPHIMSIERERPSEQKSEQKQEPVKAREVVDGEKRTPSAVQPPVEASGDGKATPSETNPAVMKGSQSGSDGSNLGVNLVPEELLQGTKRHNQVLLYGLFAGLAALLVALVFVGATLFERNIVHTTEERQAEIAVIDQDLKAMSATKQQAVLLDHDLGEIVSLLDAHTYWTKFFSLIEQYTVDSVSFTSVTADQSGRLSLAAQGADFRSVARQLVAFQEATDLVESVTITSASLISTVTGTAVSFAVSIQFIDTAIHCTATDCPTVRS